MSDVFGSDQTTDGQATTPVNEGYADQLAQIVNADGAQKYKTVEEALKGGMEGQTYIAKLEQENSQFRTEIDKRMSAEDVLAELKAGNKPDGTPPPVVDTEALEKLVDTRLDARTTAQTTKANEDLVQSKLRAEFGEKATDIVDTKAREMGLSPEALRQLSQNSPQAVLTMFGLASQPQEHTPTSLKGTVRTDSLTDTGVRNYQYYRKLSKDNPRLYKEQYSAMMADANKQGDDFFN